MRRASCALVKRKDHGGLHVFPQSLHALCPVVLAHQEIHAESPVVKKEKRVLWPEMQKFPKHITSDERWLALEKGYKQGYKLGYK